MPDRVLILGATARAAAASARRAGLTPFAIDLFADRDTVELCESARRVPLADYPRGLFDAARRLPPMPWLYTGGLENYPSEILHLATRQELLWGPSVLGGRDMALASVAGWLRPFGIETAALEDRPAGNGVWVRKSFWTAGGRGVRVAVPGDGREPGVRYQRFVPGRPMSVLFAGSTRMATHHQLIGEPWLHAPGFTYCGNLTASPVGRFGEADQSPLWNGPRLGLWGIDFIDHDGSPVVIEVNPRYTASVEVHELATGVSLLRRTEPPPPATKVVGKAVYYAARPLTIPDSGSWDESLRHCTDVWRRPDFADIPRPDDVIEPGQPVVTLLADGPTETAVLATLKARAADLDRLFGVPTPEDSP